MGIIHTETAIEKTQMLDLAVKDCQDAIINMFKN